MTIKKDLLEGISDVIRDVIESEEGEYPSEAVPKGTYVRSSRLNALGVVTDAFYSESYGQQIIIYSVLCLPNTRTGDYYLNIMESPHMISKELFVYDETEFDLTYYLMIPPVDMDKIQIYTTSGELM